jgi:hypothetical protein
MARCEDYPCCGHTDGDPCPALDARGRIIPTCCVCGKGLSRRARSSLCASCTRRTREDDGDWFHTCEEGA